MHVLDSILGHVNLTEWAPAQGSHVTTGYRWWRERALPVPARKAGRLILVSPDAVAGPARQDAAGLYARVSSRDQEADPGRQVARLSGWAAQAGLVVVRVEAEVGSGMSGARAKARRLVAGPEVTVVVVEHRDRLGRMNTGLAGAALAAPGRRPAGNRALKAVGCARQDIGSRAVRISAAGGAG
jgi:putative resolvase